MKRMNGLHFFPLLILAIICLLPARLLAQEINLDKMEKCGDMLCYQSMDDVTVYHYLPDSPRLAYKDGRPQFSFLKYARIEETGKAGTGRAQGGGIVHFLVTYGADKGRVQAAEADLQERIPEARIAGPIIYRKGSFALITSFQEENTTTTRTVAVGKAPLMEGQKAAVSLALTREGAELLWASFQTATPDISLVFDMQFAGVREPYEATLVADWARIVKHDQVKAGVKYAWFGADVDMLFQELRQDGAIKITTKGKNANLDKILQSAHAMLLKVIFDPAPVDDLTRAAAEKDSYSNLNQAVKMLKDAAGSRSSKKRSSLLYNPFSLAEFKVPEIQAERQFSVLSILDLLARPAFAAETSEQIEEARTLFKKAGNLYKNDKYDEALLVYEQVNALMQKTLGRKSVGALMNMGNCYDELKKWDIALKYYQEGLALVDRVPSRENERGLFYAYIASCLQRLNRLDESQQYLDKALKHQSDKKAAVVRKVGDVYYAMTEYAKAVSYYRQLLTLAKEVSEHHKYGKYWSQETAGKAYTKARKLDEKARASKYEQDASKKAHTSYLAYRKYVQPTGQRASEVESRIGYLAGKIGKSAGSQAVASKGSQGTSAKGAASPAAKAKKSVTGKSASSAKSTGKKKSSAYSRSKGKKAGTPKKAKKQTKTAEARSDGTPGFSLVASYRMKRIKRSGKFTYHMNHYRTESQAFAMAENIGDLFGRFGNDPKVFRAITIDDPVFKQREILVTLDGQDTETFTRHLNFVTVQMEKRHQSGGLTTDEIVITPDSFNQSGNAFVLSYGWDGDDDRTRWLDYDLHALWSFHGGVEIRMPMQSSNSAMLALNPPHRYRTVTIEGDGQRLTDKGVRHAVVTITSEINGKPVSNQVTIRNSGTAPSMVVDVPEIKEGTASEVLITWYLQGGKKLTAPVQLVEGDIVYWDELPE